MTERPSKLRIWAPWIAMAAVVLVALAIGTLGQSEPSAAERAQSIGDTIRCPQCKSQAVTSSDTPSSRAVRLLIKERIEAGDTNEEIRDYVASRYPGTLLDPPSSGFGVLVWALPVVFVIVAVAGLAFRFRDYRPTGHAVTQADRDLVADALAHEGEEPEGAVDDLDGDEPEGES